MVDGGNYSRVPGHGGQGGSSLVWLLLFYVIIILTNSIQTIAVISSLGGLLMLIFINNVLDYSVAACWSFGTSRALLDGDTIFLIVSHEKFSSQWPLVWVKFSMARCLQSCRTS